MGQESQHLAAQPIRQPAAGACERARRARGGRTQNRNRTGHRAGGRRSKPGLRDRPDAANPGRQPRVLAELLGLHRRTHVLPRHGRQHAAAHDHAAAGQGDRTPAWAGSRGGACRCQAGDEQQRGQQRQAGGAAGRGRTTCRKHHCARSPCSCWRTESVTTAVPPRTTARVAPRRLISCCTETGMVEPGTSSSGAPARAAAGPPASASG